MPWKETRPIEERLQFVRDALSDRFTMSELCARYGVSRRIGYKWLARFAEDGRRGLTDRSRRPHTCPAAVRLPLAEPLCEFRRLHPDRAHGSCCGSSAIGIRRSRTGPPRAQPPSCSRAGASCADGGADGHISVPARCRSRRGRPTTSGPPTSKGSSAPGMACTATH